MKENQNRLKKEKVEVNHFNKMGGIAALIQAGAFIIGFALMVTLLLPSGYLKNDPVKSVAFLVDHLAIMYVWNLIIYIIFGIFLVILALAIYDRLKDGAPALAQIATAFGIIWAGLVIASGMVANVGFNIVADSYGHNPEQAESLWLAIRSVEFGLGGGNEIAGGLWVLLVSWAALRVKVFPKTLNYIGVVSGVSGLLTIIPILDVLGAVFGIGLIIWYVYIGIVFLRSSKTQ